MKSIVWIGSSRKDIQSFPVPVRRDLGQALYTAQQGKTDPAAKPLKGFIGTQVIEIVDRYDTNTYRAVYTVQFSDVLYVLHAFQKKSKKGIATLKKDMDVIRKRLSKAKRDYQLRRNGKKSHTRFITTTSCRTNGEGITASCRFVCYA